MGKEAEQLEPEAQPPIEKETADVPIAPPRAHSTPSPELKLSLADVMANAAADVRLRQQAAEEENMWPIRRLCRDFVANPKFENTIIWLIIGNCISLAAFDPTSSDESARNVTLSWIELAFNICFTFEILFRVTALGSIYKHLCSAWNVFDLLIVMIGYSSYMGSSGISGLRALRALRALRPLRTVSRVPSLRSIADSFVNAVPMLLSVMSILFAYMVIFAIAGLNLMMGKYDYRCVNDENLPEEGDEYGCGGERSCPSEYSECAKGGQIDGYKGLPQSNPGFDSFFKSLLSVFIVVTLETWPTIMFRALDATSNFMIIYFLILVITGPFFIINLFLAVLKIKFSESSKEELTDEPAEAKEGSNDASKEGPEEGSQESGLKDSKDSATDRSDTSQEDATPKELSPKDPKKPGRNADGLAIGSKLSTENVAPEQTQTELGAIEREKADEEERVFLRGKTLLYDRPLSRGMYRFVTGSFFSNFFMLVIILNTVALACEHHGMSQELKDILATANLCFTLLFFVELVIAVAGLSMVGYFKEAFNCFDATIVAFSFLELVSPGSGASLTAFRSFRVFRVFKVFKHMETLARIMSVLVSSISSFLSIGLLLLLFMSIFAIMGLHVFGAIEMEVNRANFRDIFQSFMTVFQILTLEDWNIVMMEVKDKSGWLSTLYFILWVIVGNYMFLTLFLAVVMEAFEAKADAISSRNVHSTSKSVFTIMSEKFTLKKKVPVESLEDQSHLSLADIVQAAASDPVVEQEPIKKIEASKSVAVCEGTGNSHREVSCSSSRHSLVLVENEQHLSSCTRPMEMQYASSGNVCNNAHSSSSFRVTEDKVHEVAQEELHHRPQPVVESVVEPSSVVGSVVPPPELRIATQSAPTLPPAVQGVAALGHQDSYLSDMSDEPETTLQTFCNSQTMEYTMFFWIIVSCCQMAFERPTMEDDSKEAETMRIFDILITLVFTLEAILKISAFGMWAGKRGYIKNYWNQLDFLIVVTSILSLMLGSSGVSGGGNDFLAALRVFRAVRPLRVISRSRGVRIVIYSLVQSLAAMFHVMIVCFLFFFIFGILGVQLFAGTFYKCAINEDATNLREGLTTLTDDDVVMYDKVECLELGYAEWKNSYLNFDNVMNAMLTLFCVSKMDAWLDVLHDSLDATSPDKAPKHDNNPAAFFFLVAFICTVGFALVNLFIGVVFHEFTVIKARSVNDTELTEPQKQWNHITHHINRLSVPENPFPPAGTEGPLSFCRHHCFKVVTSGPFDTFIMLCIILNTVAMMMPYDAQTEGYMNAVELANTIFSVIFMGECVLKICGLGFRGYWKSGWNRFDFILVLTSIMDFTLNFLSASFLRIFRVGRISRISRIMRGFRLARGLKDVQLMVSTLTFSLPSFWSVGILLLLIFYIYAYIGVGLFGRVTHGEAVTEHSNFENFLRACITLVRVATYDGWVGLMNETSQGDCDDSFAGKGACGGTFAIPYFCSFVICVNTIILELFTAIIVQNFEELESREDWAVAASNMEEFSSSWSELLVEGDLQKQHNTCVKKIATRELLLDKTL
eukprot:gene7283-8672_t